MNEVARTLSCSISSLVAFVAHVCLVSYPSCLRDKDDL